jgi:hypothetical protein
MQNHYNLVYREEEREMFPTLKVGLYYALSRLEFLNPPFSILTWGRCAGLHWLVAYSHVQWMQ